MLVFSCGTLRTGPGTATSGTFLGVPGTTGGGAFLGMRRTAASFAADKRWLPVPGFHHGGFFLLGRFTKHSYHLGIRIGHQLIDARCHSITLRVERGHLGLIFREDLHEAGQGFLSQAKHGHESFGPLLRINRRAPLISRFGAETGLCN